MQLETTNMTPLLVQAIGLLSQLSRQEQDLLASWLLAELMDETVFDRRIVETAGKLRPLAEQALREGAAGQTRTALNLADQQ